MLNEKTRVFFATFAPYDNGRRANNGMVEPMISFFAPRIKNFLIMIQPHPGSDRINPEIEVYHQGKMTAKRSFGSFWYFPVYFFCRIQNTNHTHISFKIRDLLSVVAIGLFQKKKFDYFIGLESVNALGGIILRKLGKAGKVIYLVSDYSPVRYKNKMFNYLYLWLDRFCAVNADVIWDVSPAMQTARIKAGLDPEKSAPVVVTPNGLFPSQIKSLPVKRRFRNSLVYLGTLGYENGPDLAIEALSIIIRKYPEAKLHLIGGGREAVDDLARLKRLTKALGLDKSVKFYGFIADNDKMAEIVRSCYVAVAPYRAIENSVRWYADATKIRQYLASGLPVVSTQVPPLGRKIADQGAGLMINDNKEEFAQAVLRLFEDNDLYRQMAAKAEEISKNNTWQSVYENSFSAMLKMGL